MENKIEIREICCDRNYDLSVGFHGVCYGFGYNCYGKCGVDIKENSIRSSQNIDVHRMFKIIKIKCTLHHSYICGDHLQPFLFSNNDDIWIFTDNNK